jgi:hypothetical protein
LLVEFARPLTVILGGGLTQMSGFDGLLRAEVADRVAPETVGPIRRVESDEYAVARGLLIHATLVLQSRQRPERMSA